jgi:1-deoxy-D-xylulose-5-phosphate synthase
MERGCCAVVKSFAFPDAYIEQGTRSQLFERYGMNADGLYRQIKLIIDEQMGKIV